MKPTAATARARARPFADRLDERAAEDGLRKGERTRRRVEAATARLLEDHGYHELRMGDIAETAAISHGAVYRYFANKKEVSLKVLGDFARHSHDQLLASGGEGSVYDRIRASTLFYVENFALNVGLGRCIRQLSDEMAEFRELWIGANADWYRVVAASLAREGARTKEAEKVALDVAHACGAMVDEMVHDVFVRRDPALAHYRREPKALGELLALLWYRAAYASNPESSAARRQPAFGLEGQTETS